MIEGFKDNSTNVAQINEVEFTDSEIEEVSQVQEPGRWLDFDPFKYGDQVETHKPPLRGCKYMPNKMTGPQEKICKLIS